MARAWRSWRLLLAPLRGVPLSRVLHWLFEPLAGGDCWAARNIWVARYISLATSPEALEKAFGGHERQLHYLTMVLHAVVALVLSQPSPPHTLQHHFRSK